jgi:hypothetical protein
MLKTVGGFNRSHFKEIWYYPIRIPVFILTSAKPDGSTL